MEPLGIPLRGSWPDSSRASLSVENTGAKRLELLLKELPLKGPLTRSIGVPLKRSIEVPLKGSVAVRLRGSIGAPLKGSVGGPVRDL